MRSPLWYLGFYQDGSDTRLEELKVETAHYFILSIIIWRCLFDMLRLLYPAGVTEDQLLHLGCERTGITIDHERMSSISAILLCIATD